METSRRSIVTNDVCLLKCIGPSIGNLIAILVTGLTGYPIAIGPFSHKTVWVIFDATYSSVTRGKYLINFSREGEKKWVRHRRGAENAKD